MKTNVISLVLLALLFVAVAIVPVRAQSDRSTTSASIEVDKKVSVPGNGGYVDNLSSSDAKFKAGQDVFFKLTVRNPSSVTINDVKVKDIVPAHLYVVGGTGSYDSNTRIVTIDVGSLSAGQSREFTLQMRVVANSALPTDRNIVCVLNRAETTATSTGTDDDSAQLCIERAVTATTDAVGGVTKVPATGPEMGFALLGLQAVGVAAGVYLKKKSA